MARTRAIRAALTQAAIRDAQPGAKRRILWDGQTPGLGVLVHPTCHKSFIVQRGVGGRTFKDTLGTFPEMTLAEARRLAEEPLATIRAGRNPNEERREQRVAAEHARRERVPCSELWKRYDADVIAVHNTASTAAGKRWRWKVRIEPVIGNVAVRDVDGSHISEIVNAPLRRDKNGLVVKGKGEAGNLYRLLRSLMKKAEKWKLRQLGSDPTKEVEERDC